MCYIQAGCGINAFQVVSKFEYFSQEGYTKLRFIKDAEESEIDELIATCEMKKPAAKTLKKAWKALERPVPDSPSTRDTDLPAPLGGGAETGRDAACRCV